MGEPRRTPVIRLRYTAGPASHATDIALIGPYPDTTDRDREIQRLRALAGEPVTPWAFEPYEGDRQDADLWGDAAEIAAATEDLLAPDGLLHDPGAVLDSLYDPAEPTRGWYGRYEEVLSDG